jgi:hypothetical protein
MSANAVPSLVLLLCAIVAAAPAQPASIAPTPLQPALLQPASAQPVTPPATLLLPRLTDKVIRDAVRETLAEPPENPRRYEADTMRGNSYIAFSEQFSEAKVPDCLHSDGLKRQPPRIGPIGFSYLFAVPFVVLAKIRGKCN